MFHRHRLFLILLFLFTGLAAGAAVPEFLRMGTGSYAGFLSLYGLQKYETVQLRMPELFGYITEVRLGTLLFLWMSSFTSAGVLLHLLYGWWLAASAGMLLALFSLKDGMQGIGLFVCCLFPQWLLYAAAWRREFVFFAKQYRRSIHTEDIRQRTARGQSLLELGQMAGLMTAGCACEAFLGTQVLKIFLKFFS